MASGGLGGPEGSPRSAVAALCGLYHEAGQRLRRLQDQLAARDALVARLQARLAALEAEAAPSLVDALLEQVARFREQLRRQEGGAGPGAGALRQEVERPQQGLEEEERETEALAEEEVVVLRRSLAEEEVVVPRGSLAEEEVVVPRGSLAEEEVVVLRRSLAEKARAQAASDVLCRSLTDEAQRLRRTLAATAHMCQQLARRLEERPSAQGDPAERGPAKAAAGGTPVQASIQKLQEENRLLKQKVMHVEDLNAKWQRYDASRDEYVRGLHAQLGGLPGHPRPNGHASPELLRKEISRLNRELEEKIQESAEARRELAAARRARDVALERVQMLEQQVLVYRDDFSSERADRERAQSRLQALQEEVASLQHRASRRQDSREPGLCGMHPGGRAPPYMEPDAPECATPAAQRLETPMEGGRPGDLQCPRCMRCFGDEQGEELLGHVAECCQ